MDRRMRIICLLCNAVGLIAGMLSLFAYSIADISDQERVSGMVYVALASFWFAVNTAACLVRAKPLLYLSSILNIGAFLISWYYLYGLITGQLDLHEGLILFAVFLLNSMLSFNFAYKMAKK